MNIKEIIVYFDYTKTKTSRQYLFRLFNEEEFSLDKTLERQKILEIFIKNQKTTERLKTNDSEIKTILSFINNTDSSNYNQINKILYRKEFRLIDNNINITINFLHSFRNILQSIIFSEEIEYKNEIQQKILFIDTFKIEELYYSLHQNKLSFKQRKFFLMQIASTNAKNMFVNFWDFFYMFDVYCSLSKGIINSDLVFPRFNKNKTFNIKNFYHLKLSTPVKNSIDFKNNNIIIFTGPNMSGKSTIMKSITIVVLLAHIGVGVPAAFCNIPFYQKIKFFFNVNDDLEKGHSYFMQELLNLKDVLVDLKLGKKSFIVFDEIFKGTNINDAMSITIKTIKGLSQFKDSIFLVSSHLNMIDNDLSLKNILKLKLDCIFVNNELKFTYKIEEGWAKLELGSVLFKNLGLNELLE